MDSITELLNLEDTVIFISDITIPDTKKNHYPYHYTVKPIYVLTNDSFPQNFGSLYNPLPISLW